MAKEQPHPLRRGDGAHGASYSACSQLLLRIPEDGVLVAAAAVVQIAAGRRHKLQRLSATVLVGVLWKGDRRGPFALRSQLADQPDPARDLKIAQPSRAVLQVRFEMKNRLRELRVPRVGDFNQPLNQ